MFKNLKGLSDYTQLNFIKRFEYGYFFKNNLKRNFEMSAFEPLRYKIFNAYISKIMNTNRSINELIRLNAIRLYLIKTFRGRARALGKPSRGQRT
jgi:ribosomal protein S13